MSYILFFSAAAGYYLLTSIILMASSIKQKSRKRKQLPKIVRKRRQKEVRPLFLTVLMEKIASVMACRRLLKDSCRSMLQIFLMPLFKRLSTLTCFKGISQQHYAEQPDSESVSKELESYTEDISKKPVSSSSKLHSDAEDTSKEDPEVPEDDKDVVNVEDNSEETVYPCDAEVIDERESPDIGAVENLKDIVIKVVVNISYTEGSFEDDVIISSGTSTPSSSDDSTFSTSMTSVDACTETGDKPDPKSSGSGGFEAEQCNTETATPEIAGNLWTKTIKGIFIRLCSLLSIVCEKTLPIVFWCHMKTVKFTGTEEDKAAALRSNGNNSARKSTGSGKFRTRMKDWSVFLLLMFGSGSCLAQDYMPVLTVTPHLVHVGDRVFGEYRFGGKYIDCHMDWSINGTVLSPSNPLYPAEFLPEYSTGHLAFTARHFHHNSEVCCTLSVDFMMLKYMSIPAVIQFDGNAGAPIDGTWLSNATLLRPISDDTIISSDHGESGSGFSGNSLNNSYEMEQSGMNAGVSVNASDWWTFGRIAGLSLGLVTGALIVLVGVIISVLVWLYWRHCKKSKKSFQNSETEVDGNDSNTEQKSTSNRRTFRMCNTRLKAASVVPILMSVFHTASSHDCNPTATMNPPPWSRFSGNKLNCSDGMDQYGMKAGISVTTVDWWTSERIPGVSLVLGVGIPLMFMVSFLVGILVWLSWRHYMKQTSEETEWTSVDGDYRGEKNPEEETTGPVPVESTSGQRETIIAQETNSNLTDEYRKFLVPQPRTAIIVAHQPAKGKANARHRTGERHSAVDHLQEPSQISRASIVALNNIFPLPLPQTATTNDLSFSQKYFQAAAPPRRPQLPLELMLESGVDIVPISQSFEISHRLSKTSSIGAFLACSECATT